MKTFIRNFRLAAEIFSPGLLILVVITMQYMANPVDIKKKAEAANSEKKTASILSFKTGIFQSSNHFLNKHQTPLTINTYQL